MKNITIVIPCYNEEDSIFPFYEEVIKYLNNPNYFFKLLFVNDGSDDKTLERIKELYHKDERVRYISFSRNFGKESALHAGLERCSCEDALIFIDADLQHPPYLIVEMIKYWEEGYKLVYARHRSRKGEGLLKRFFAKAFYKIFESCSNIKLESGVKDFQLLDRRVIQAYLSMKDNNRFVKGMFSWVGFEKKCIFFDYVPRKIGKTSWSFKKLFKYGFNGINQFSSFLLALPVIFMIVVFGFMITDIVLCLLKIVESSWMWEELHKNFYMLIILFLFYFAFYLIYNTRAEIIKRPIYIIDEEDIDNLRK